MTISFAFSLLPGENVRVIAAGIYSGEEPVVTICLKNRQVGLTREGLDPLVLSEEYTPGEWIDLMMIIHHGRIRVLRSLQKIGEWPLEKGELHFRAGCEVGIEPRTVAGSSFSGEVEIRKLFVTHKP